MEHTQTTLTIPCVGNFPMKPKSIWPAPILKKYQSSLLNPEGDLKHFIIGASVLGGES